MPTAADLDDPLGFGEHAELTESSDDESFDAALAELLDEESGPDSEKE
jgi:hypothetical protein